MNDDLRHLVHDKLSAEGLLEEDWSSLVLAACDGPDAVASLLLDAKTAAKPAAPAEQKQHAGAYLASLTVQGFRGIGPKQTLTFTPGPGLTIVIGRNGSGKSSFAEALEVLFTGDSKRWSDRSKIWKEGWRSLHQPHPAHTTRLPSSHTFPKRPAASSNSTHHRILFTDSITHHALPRVCAVCSSFAFGDAV